MQKGNRSTAINRNVKFGDFRMKITWSGKKIDSFLKSPSFTADMTKFRRSRTTISFSLYSLSYLDAATDLSHSNFFTSILKPFICNRNKTFLPPIWTSEKVKLNGSKKLSNVLQDKLALRKIEEARCEEKTLQKNNWKKWKKKLLKIAFQRST